MKPKPKSIFITALCSFLFLCMSACTPIMFGMPITGRVIDGETGKGVPDVWVAARWHGYLMFGADTRSTCVHVEAAKTNASGRYVIPGWMGMSDFWNLYDVSSSVSIYKPGYVRVMPPKGEYETRNFRMVKSTETITDAKERVVNAAFTLNCGDAGISQRSFYPEYVAIYEEAKALGMDERNNHATFIRPSDLSTIREMAAWAWVDPDNSMPRDEREEKMKEFLENHLK